MDDKVFLEGYELISRKLIGLPVEKVFNSIGSNVFFEFGKEQEVVFKNGRKKLQREWSIWLSEVSWKITKANLYIVGSGDFPEDIQAKIQQLLNKKLLSFQFQSNFLDLALNFEEGYQITTFFDRISKNPWTVFYPNEASLSPDYANLEGLESTQATAKQLIISENYKQLNFPKTASRITQIIYDKHQQPTMHFEDTSLISFINCTWRLEKGERYLTGYLEEDSSELQKLIGKELIQIDIGDNLQDARFLFGDQYIIKSFVCAYAEQRLKIEICDDTKII